jgi:hypothetical protein
LLLSWRSGGSSRSCTCWRCASACCASTRIASPSPSVSPRSGGPVRPLASVLELCVVVSQCGVERARRVPIVSLASGPPMEPRKTDGLTLCVCVCVRASLSFSVCACAGGWQRRGWGRGWRGCALQRGGAWPGPGQLPVEPRGLHELIRRLLVSRKPFMSPRPAPPRPAPPLLTHPLILAVRVAGGARGMCWAVPSWVVVGPGSGKPRRTPARRIL